MNVVMLPIQRKAPTQHPLGTQETPARSVLWRQQNPAETERCRPETDQVSALPLPASRSALFVGREVELTQLHLAFAKALGGKRQVVFVSGEAGIGKTTLVDTFLAQLRERADVRIAAGQCVEQYGPGEAYLPLLEATARLCRGAGGERRIAALARHAPSWLAQLPSLLEPQDYERLQHRVQGTNRERMLREMAEVAEGFAAARAVVLVLEDLHWVDVSTLDWITYMARRRGATKLLILGTYRPADVLANNHPLHGVVQELWARGQCEVVPLAPLSEEATAEYLTVRLNANTEIRGVVPEQLVPLLHQRTSGNPLFLVNTVDDLIRQGVFAEEVEQGTPRPDAVKAIREGIPDTVRQLIERQLERLPESERRLLEAASVVGVEFAAAEVAAGLLTEQETIEAACERLARTGRWLRTGGAAEWPDGTISGRYSFLHAVHHEVVYAQVAEVRRVQLHRRMAARKEAAYGERVGEIATELAVHFEVGREPRQASVYLEQAGRNALQRSANAEATRHFTRALTVLAQVPASVERTRQELTLHLALGTPLLALKGYGSPEVRRHYQQARALCQALGDPPELFPVLWGLWIAHAVAGELSTAEEFGGQLAQFAQQRGDADLALQAHHALWTTLVARGELTTCQSHIEHGLQLYQTDRHFAQTFVYGGHDAGACCRIHGGYLYWLLGYPDRALQLSEEALVLGTALSHGQTRAWALSGNAMVHHFRGEPIAAQQAAEEAMALSTEHQFALWEAYSPPVLGWALAMQGKTAEGLAHVQAGLVALRATGTGIWQSQFLALLASVHGEAGQLQEGLHAIEEGLVVAARNGERFYEAELYRLKGDFLWQENQKSKVKAQKSKVLDAHSQSLDPDSEAETCFLHAIEIARQQQAKSWELRASMSLARLWQQQGKTVDARELLEDIYDWFTEGFDTKDLRDAAALLCELGGRVRTEEESQKSKVKSQKSKIPAPRPLNPDPFPPSPQHLTPSPQHPPNPQPPAPNTFRPEGEYWTVSFAGETCRLKDARGLHFIVHLLQQPHQEVHVLTLITTGEHVGEEAADTSSFHDASLAFDHTDSFSDAGEILDPQARAAYKQRVRELREELAEAQQFHDLGRSERLAAEIDFLAQELSRAVGLGGRVRRAGSPAERARVNITRAMKIALRKISEHHPALGQHLATTIKTGTYCSYTPDVRMPITWQG